jgi:hypothetical protein
MENNTTLDGKTWSELKYHTPLPLEIIWEVGRAFWLVYLAIYSIVHNLSFD